MNLSKNGKLLCDLRKAKGMTQKEVADMLGISQSYISRLERKIMNKMKKDIIVTAKTIEDAAIEGAGQLGVAREDVEIEVLEEPKKGFFGMGAVPAKVKVTYILKPLEAARNFIEICNLLTLSVFNLGNATYDSYAEYIFAVSAEAAI